MNVKKVTGGGNKSRRMPACLMLMMMMMMTKSTTELTRITRPVKNPSASSSFGERGRV